MSYITCKDLAVGYDGRSVASGLNFSIDKGDYLCIVGENGAGKSTLVKTLLGLLKPVSGEIKFGDDLTSHDIGYLPQQTPVQKDFPATVWEVALSGALTKCGARPFYGRKEKQLAQSQLERLGIYAGNATGICQEDSSSASFWREPCVQLRIFFCLTNR